jgi:hypothetical protein
MGVLLPGGVAGALILAAQAVKSWRDGRSSREETVLERWQRLAREAEDDKAIAEHNEEHSKEVADYWRMRCADLTFLARTHKLELPPAHPMPVKKDPPRRRNGTQKRVRQSSRSEELEDSNNET